MPGHVHALFTVNNKIYIVSMLLTRYCMHLPSKYSQRRIPSRLDKVRREKILFHKLPFCIPFQMLAFLSSAVGLKFAVGSRSDRKCAEYSSLPVTSSSAGKNEGNPSIPN